jgi:hypothetical protein
MWSVGRPPPGLHTAGVRPRAARGGHDIPEDRIRERYEHSRVNLIRLLPHLTELRVFDNSKDADPASGHVPVPLRVLHMVNGAIADVCGLSRVPDWAKPIVAAAMASVEGRSGGPYSAPSSSTVNSVASPRT